MFDNIYRHELAKYQVVASGKANDPYAEYLVTSKHSALFYSSLTIKQAFQIDWENERVNFTEAEINQMRDWEDLKVDWQRSVHVDPQVHYGWVNMHSKTQLQINVEKLKQRTSFQKVSV